MELREQPSKTDAVMDCGESVVLHSTKKRRGEADSGVLRE